MKPKSLHTITQIPDLVLNGYDHSSYPAAFTGLLRIDKDDYTTHIWLVKGQYHRELGPALVWSDVKEGVYYLDYVQYPHNEYWKIMFEKYHGTEHEELVLAHMLAK